MDSKSKKKKFSEIATTYMSALKGFALSLCKNNFDADDLVSETIIKAYTNFEKIKDENLVRSWLFKILSNQFLSNYRSNKKFVDLVENDNDQEDIELFSLFERISTSNFVEEGNPEKKFISKLTQQQIQTAVNELPEEFRLALMLCDMEDFTYAEISMILKIPVGTVRSRISRARVILQKRLWLQAQELGIRTSKVLKQKEDIICACDNEEAPTPEMHDKQNNPTSNINMNK
ncbi:MAG: sigma-70 family RNA polymerase sigma factor [Bacteroidota bacterium]|nr:sigma-70 family RNA polymerase sigma factor [Bacteroidota bacterium]